jgi:hypothetical protein
VDIGQQAAKRRRYPIHAEGEREMLTRREVVLGGALTLLWGSCACAQAEPGLRGRHSFGCTLDPAEAEPFLSTATEPQAFDSMTSPKIITSTGNRDFDYALAQTLSHLTDTFGVLPGFCYYDDYDGENAMATASSKLQRADGTVMYGKRYLMRCMSIAESPEAVVSATCAHEFGHIVQYKHRLDGALKQGQPNVKRLELHADFFAGYFAGSRKLAKPDYPAAVFATNRFARGDHNFDAQHHGTPEERAAAVVRGFETCYRERHNFADAIQIGMNYALSL